MEHLPRVLILMATHNAQVTIAKQLDTMVALASLWITGWEFFWVFWPIGGIGCGLASVVIGAVADRRVQTA